LVIGVQNEPALFSLDWLKVHGPRIGVLILLAVTLSWLASVAVRRFRRRLEGSPDATVELNLQRVTTLAGIIASTVRVVVWTVVGLMLLGELGLNLAPLLAGAGIVGLALGFGAQSLVRDFLAGFFILLESQFAVGDSVELSALGGNVTGRVHAITLRTTSIRAPDGTLSVVPNGNIQISSNKSRGRGEVTVEETIPAAGSVEEIRGQLEELVVELGRDDYLSLRISSEPRVAGLEPGSEGQMLVRIAAETRPSRREEVEKELRRRIRQRFRTGPPPDAG
jgi:moderate conductance mechanosensitive channel